MARGANVLAIAVSPLVLYFAVTRLSVTPAALLVAGWITVRTVPAVLAASRAQIVAALKLPAVAIFFSLLGAAFDDSRFLLLLPSATQLGFAGVFAASLRRPRVPLVEQFARMQKKDLPDEEVRYCRSVTVVWAGYLSACAAVGLVLAWAASPVIWAIFTGAGSYVAVGILFGAEFAYRKVRFRSPTGSAIEKTLFRWFPRSLPSSLPSPLPETTAQTDTPAEAGAPQRGGSLAGLTAFGIRLVAFWCALLGRRVTSGLLWVFAAFAALVASGARRASRAYLARIGEPTHMRAVITHLWSFGRVWLDGTLLVTGRGRDLDVRWHDEAAAQHALRRGAQSASGPDSARRRGAILLGAHLGSFEALRAMAVRDDLSVNVLADARTAAHVNGVLARLSPQKSFRMVAVDPTRATSMLDVRERIDRGELVAIFGDRLSEQKDRSVEAELLGGKAPFPTEPYLLAHMLGCPVYLVFALFHAPNRYEVHCEELAESVRLPRPKRAEVLRTISQKYATRLEAHARLAPYNWFNFYPFWNDERTEEAAEKTPSVKAT